MRDKRNNLFLFFFSNVTCCVPQNQFFFSGLTILKVKLHKAGGSWQASNIINEGTEAWRA